MTGAQVEILRGNHGGEAFADLLFLYKQGPASCLGNGTAFCGLDRPSSISNHNNRRQVTGQYDSDNPFIEVPDDSRLCQVELKLTRTDTL